MEAMTGDQVVQAARRFLGVPFKLHGRSEHGMDCLGLVVCVAKQFGLDFDLTDYDWKGFAVADLEHFFLSHGFTSISPQDFAIGDVQIGPNLINGKATGVCIISRTGNDEVFGITVRGLSVSQMRIVEDSIQLSPSDFQRMKQELSSHGYEMAASSYFRFPSCYLIASSAA
jgi:hypothetical protein